MCAIFGSRDLDTFLQLAELNLYRGSHSYSVAAFNIEEGRIEFAHKQFGEFYYGHLPESTALGKHFLIGHVQAPTTEATLQENIHPCEYHGTYLWHNGIIKASFCEQMRTNMGVNHQWDTRLLHEWIVKDQNLSAVDGTFSCLLYQYQALFLLRNEISPMYVDDKLNISSTRFENSVQTQPGQILRFNFESNKLEQEPYKSFETKNNPYYFGDYT